MEDPLQYASPARTPWWQYLLLTLAAITVYFYALGDSPLDRTEPHRALVAHQMVLSHQWLIPRLNGEVYLRKPPLIYWAEGAAEKLFGRGDEFVWRFPSAAGSVLLVLGVAVWTGRYLGGRAAIPAGFAVLSLIPLWEQDRGADIDALNTAAATASALLALSILHRQTRRRWLLIVPLSIAIACTLLLKGPGGLPPVLGAVIGPAVVLRSWRWLVRPAFWVALLIGFSGFIAYGIAAKLEMRREQIVPTTDGFREALQRMILHRWQDVLPAVLAPLTTLAYAVPASLAVLFVWIVKQPSNRSDAAVIPVSTLGAGLMLFLAAGNGNARYEYVLLPLLGPIAGWVIAGSDSKEPRTEGTPAVSGPAGNPLIAGAPSVRGSSKFNHLAASEQIVLQAFREVWFGIQIVVTVAIWKSSDHHAALVIAASLSAIACHLPLVLRRSVWSPLSGWTAALMIPLLIVPMGQRKNIERSTKSARAAAAELRSVVGDLPVGVASMNRDMPELLYYAGMPVRAFGERGLDKLTAAGGQWVVVTQNAKFPEYQTILWQVPGAFPRDVRPLKMPGSVHYPVYVGWYDPPAGHPTVSPPKVLPGLDEDDE
jgi:4-amino-4-deoxy-L-arabinose transferase-like glycosyltransferase